MRTPVIRATVRVEINVETHSLLTTSIHLIPTRDSPPLDTNPVYRLAMLRHACLVLGASALHVSARDELLAVVVPAHRGDLELAVHSMTNWPCTRSLLTEQNVDLVLYYAGSSEEDDDEAVSAAADTIAKTAGRCFANTRTVFAELEQKVRPIRTSTRKLPLKAVRCPATTSRCFIFLSSRKQSRLKHSRFFYRRRRVQ